MSLLKDPLEIEVALLRGLATARTPKLHKIHRLFLRKSLVIAWKGHPSLQVTLVGSCVPPAPMLCCLVAPGAGSLAGKPKLVMVPLDLGQIQPLHPFIRAKGKRAWLSPGCATVSWSTRASKKEQKLFGFVCYQEHVSQEYSDLISLLLILSYICICIYVCIYALTRRETHTLLKIQNPELWEGQKSFPLGLSPSPLK